MKFNLATILATTLAVTVTAAPANEAMTLTTRAKVDHIDDTHANFIKLWKEDGMNRWRWQYAGNCDDYKNAIKTSSGSINNFRCLEKDGKQFFDTNMVVGFAGDRDIIRAIKELTEQSCCDLGLPVWARDTCLEMFRASDECDMTKD
ncbi:hypothetical protein N7516_009581 [Penicillium verrucosum]|uniref:uncharacterized protein n=1 Tax=Penicillium verrucosum TaxID=60171 RepID=UPI002544F193|nr:uncharacterized protein N7516_009581 [Penicillium verrucosum]KAJ5921878.1 hypothetical protein N7516_009581 [Penicillium verrucosum]